MCLCACVRARVRACVRACVRVFPTDNPADEEKCLEKLQPRYGSTLPYHTAIPYPHILHPTKHIKYSTTPYQTKPRCFIPYRHTPHQPYHTMLHRITQVSAKALLHTIITASQRAVARRHNGPYPALPRQTGGRRMRGICMRASGSLPCNINTEDELCSERYVYV